MEIVEDQIITLSNYYLLCVFVRGVKGLLGLSPLGLISRLLRGQVYLSI